MRPRSRPWCRLGSVALAAWLWPRFVLAEGTDAAPSVVLVVRGCGPEFAQAMSAILELELGEMLLPAGAERGRDANSLEIVCEAGRARVSVADAADGGSIDSVLGFDAFPGDAAPRAVALAGVEALSALNPSVSKRLQARREAAARSHPRADTMSTKPARATAPRTTVPPPARSPVRFRVGLGALQRTFLVARGASARGGRTEFAFRSGRAWEIGLDLDLGVAHRSISPGRLTAVMLSSGAWLGLAKAAPHWSALIAAGARAGLVELRGNPATAEIRGHQVLRPWAGPALGARLGAGFQPLEISARGEAGFAALSAEGDALGSAAVRLSGAWLAASLNLELLF